MLWSSHQIRKTFLEYFASKGHEIVDSAPLVIKDDPTLMFTNAGMNQFKPVFLGNTDPSSLRIADTQKCLRVSGKHNDLEEVGKDHYHHTMFEMLGNWSFGDYFKKEAIEWAWELLTEVYKLDKDRLYVTVFEGDKQLELDLDLEAQDFWKLHIEADRIIPCNRKDNFWEMGETGPCGPCSEIHIDLRTEAERAAVDGKTLVNKDHPEVIEVWNLVFIQFNMLENGDLIPLKAKHVDTGMGLERLARALQKTASNYDIDVFESLISRIEKLAGVKYGGSESEKDVAFRVIADHVRAIAFSIADGQLPSNTGSGYVIRRILRRAVRYAFSVLGQKEPMVFQVAKALVDEMGEAFPELKRNDQIIFKVIEEEEKSFLQTLEKGLQKLEHYFSTATEKKLPGAFVFVLYDSDGFPVDLTELIASEHGFSVDLDGFNKHLEEQKNRSRAASKAEFGDWDEVGSGASEFIGYDSVASEAQILRFRKVKQKGKDAYQVVLSKTPFYAESGGQVGDKGWLIQGDAKAVVFDTKKENNEIVHFLVDFPFDTSLTVEAQVNESSRSNIMKNHTATHLLHHALRKHLGKHVEQKGSLVSPDRLRFDFSHFEKVKDEELEAITTEVEAMMNANLQLEEWRNMPIDEAKELGAMALFGEKYGNEVRVIKFGESVELCGGTHLKSTGAVGGFRITSESSNASGIRRIEAITGDAYQAHMKNALERFEQLGVLLGNPKDEVEALGKLLEDNKKLRKALELASEREQRMYGEQFRSLLASDAEQNFHVLRIDSVDGKVLKDAAYSAVAEKEDAWLIVIGEKDDKPFVISAISKSLVEKSDLNAGNQVKEIATAIDGGGGGQKHLAMAGGKNKQGLERALVIAKEIQRIQAS